LRRRRGSWRGGASGEQRRWNHDGDQRGIAQLPEAGHFFGNVGHKFSSTVERPVQYDNPKVIDSQGKRSTRHSGSRPAAQKSTLAAATLNDVGRTGGRSMRILLLLPLEATSFPMARSF
jgi:hypothetical protein